MKLSAGGKQPASRTWAYFTGAYVLLVLAFSVAPISLSLPGIGPTDKITHFLEYAGLMWLLVHAAAWGRSVTWRLRFALLAVCVGLGLAIELVQSMLPWRAAELGDALANTAGALVALWLTERLPYPLGVVRRQQRRPAETS
jgi:VanZ family protein